MQSGGHEDRMDPAFSQTAQIIHIVNASPGNDFDFRIILAKLPTEVFGS